MALLKQWLQRPAGIAITAIALLAPAAQASSLTEAQVKAALLYNFASFVEWPDQAGPATPIVICVIGNDAVVRALRSAPGKLATGRPLEIRSLDESEDPRRCQLLFLSAVQERSIAATLARIQAASVLTVGEHDQFTRLGGIIRIYSDDGHVRFEIDAAHATQVRLKISSRVLGLARIVRNEDVVKP
jgi:hypothetical protein